MKMLVLAAASLIATVALGAAPAEARNWHHGHGWHTKTVCKTTWRHHHRVRTCHKVRVRW